MAFHPGSSSPSLRASTNIAHGHVVERLPPQQMHAGLKQTAMPPESK